MTTLADPHASLALLRWNLAGSVLVEGDDGYDTHRACWNRRFEHRPDIIVVAATTDDVAFAVRYARAEGLRLAIQTTGHGVARTAGTGAMLLDLSRLVEVSVDPVEQTATFAGGTTWAPILAAAAAHGLAPLLGSTPHVGAVGYTLGGGLGWLARAHGICRNTMVAAEVVTPDGDIIDVDEINRPELFWALRGGGTGGLGIVTSMTIQLLPVSQVYGGNLFYPAEMAPQVMARYAEWITDLPEAMTSSVVVMNFPPFEEVPEPIRGQSFVIVRGCYDGPLHEGQALVDQWRQWNAPALDMFGPMPFSEVGTISNDPVDPLPAAVSTEWLTELSSEVIETLCAATLPAGGPPTLLFSEVRHIGGAARNGSGPELGNPSDLLLEVVAVTPFPEAEIAAAAAIADMRRALASFTTGGTYLNFTEGEEKRDRSRSGFSPSSYERLRATKAELDPTDTICHGIDLTR